MSRARRSGRLRRAWDDLRGASGPRIVALVAAQIATARSGAVLALETAHGRVAPPAARARMARIEHEGDAARAELVKALRGSLATPIDREDLYRLSRSVDDVLDHLRDYVREGDLFGPTGPTDGTGAGGARFAVEPLRAIIDGLDGLEVALGRVLADPASVTSCALAARKAGGRVRQHYQAELARLFAGPLEMEVLRRRELLARLDTVGRRLGEAADALADAMLKRSM
ncbi:DUF47 domain-containing protein [Nonomuraea soli]|uniref:DUF47 family protein n=1 Tax=Nonomuraea soli TaxID=1032476 RepID=A0A7W0HV39_9ACTN|nr:DUF47 family protein [Nonomuraea soli]MBA2896381.1 hypothetical protein [Nonomuraea soli]